MICTASTSSSPQKLMKKFLLSPDQHGEASIKVNGTYNCAGFLLTSRHRRTLNVGVRLCCIWWGVGGSNPFGVKCQSDVLIQKSYRVLGPAQVTPLTPFPTTANTFFMQFTSLKQFNSAIAKSHIRAKRVNQADREPSATTNNTPTKAEIILINNMRTHISRSIFIISCNNICLST